MIFFLLSFLSLNLFSQNSFEFKGRVVSEDYQSLIGANVKLISLPDSVVIGKIADVNGDFNFGNVKQGNYKISISYVGYQRYEEEIEIITNSFREFTLIGGIVRSKTIEIVADRAKFRETPIAYSEMSKDEISLKLGTDDIPMIMNETAGVYATQNGNGFGESRINIRGFKQRNLAVMINGVPINDMENGAVFWSNWDGIGDVTSSQQVQRGLGASKIANPSVGGTMNILTDPSKKKAGIIYKQQYSFYDNELTNFSIQDELGNTLYDRPFSDRILQSRLILNTGLINKLAMTFAFSRKTGEGPTDGTWIDAYSYYAGLSYDISKNHYLDIYVYGAPQRHGRKSFRLQIAQHDSKFAKEVGVSQESIDALKNSDGIDYGRTYNPNWGYYDFNSININETDTKVNVNRNLNLNGDIVPLYDDSFLNQSINFYHKPHVTLNWNWLLDDKSSLTSVFYISTGTGGGTNRNGLPVSQDLRGSGLMIWEDSYATNYTNYDNKYWENVLVNRSQNVLTSNVNNHFWTGYLGTYDINLDNNLKIQTGLDLRYYRGEHYTMLSNLLGGDYYIETYSVTDPKDSRFGTFTDTVSNQNIANDKSKWLKREGDRLGYDYNSYISQLGAFFQIEKKWKDVTAYFNTSAINSRYQREDFFKLPANRLTEVESFIGYTIKLGGNYNLNNNFNVYGNTGFFSRPPFFNAVFNNYNLPVTIAENEKVIALELGAGFQTDDRNFTSRLNLYYTNWRDQTRTFNLGANDSQSEDFIGIINLYGQDAIHMGAEWDFFYKFMRGLYVNGAVSLGYWKWSSNPKISPDDPFYDENLQGFQTNQLFADGLRVGDAPQTMVSLSGTYKPLKDLRISLSWKYNDQFYSDFNPETLLRYVESGSGSIPQPWQVPAYWTLNLYTQYKFWDVLGYFNLVMNFRISNLTDNLYISDAQFRQNTVSTIDKPDEVEVHLGFPRQYSIDLQIEL